MDYFRTPLEIDPHVFGERALRLVKTSKEGWISMVFLLITIASKHGGSIYHIITITVLVVVFVQNAFKRIMFEYSSNINTTEVMVTF